MICLINNGAEHVTSCYCPFKDAAFKILHDGLCLKTVKNTDDLTRERRHFLIESVAGKWVSVGGGGG